MAKAKKKREKKYDPKLAIKGSFEEVVSLSVGKPPTVKKMAKKNTK